MKNRFVTFSLCFLGLLLFSFPACAQLKITASITVTNKTTNGMVITLNGDTRTWTNNVVNSATQIATNADTTGCGSKTNLLTQIQLTPFSQTRSVNTGSNSLDIVGNADLPMSLTVSAGYASVSYSTQVVTDLVLAQLPVSGLPTAAARTNVASGIAGALNRPENTNAISQISTAASELMGTTNAQTISGRKSLLNTNNLLYGILFSLLINGNIGCTTNGVLYNPILSGPTLTNGVNYGQYGFSSQNTNGLFGEQFGQFSTATGISSTALGVNSTASGDLSVAIGSGATATNQDTLAVGVGAIANGSASVAIGTTAQSDGWQSVALGTTSSASGSNSVALGTFASAPYANSTAIGTGAGTTSTDQVMLGAPGISTVVQNNLKVQTNLQVLGNAYIQGVQTNITASGTNNFLAESDIAFVRKSLSSLANGNNAAIPVGTNVFVEVSGPSGAFTVNGIAGGRDGKLLILENATGQTMTIANQSGTDPTAANRILTGLSGDYANTNNPGCVTLIYNASVSRWILVSHN